MNKFLAIIFFTISIPLFAQEKTETEIQNKNPDILAEAKTNSRSKQIRVKQIKPKQAKVKLVKAKGTKVIQSDVKQAEEKQVEENQTEAKQDEAKQVDLKSVDTKTADAKSVDTKTVDTKTVDTKTVDTKTVDAKSVDTKTVDAKSVDTKTVDAKSADSKPDFVITQFVANDVNFRGLSIYGEKLSRRNQEQYKSFSEAWLISTNVVFQLPLSGLKFQFTANNPFMNRTDKDSDQRFQTSPNGESQLRRVNQYISTGVLDFDPNSIKPRKDQNGLRDVFIGQMYYDWDTKIGGFRTGLFFLNNQNYPAKFNLGEWVLSYKPSVLKFLNPEITSFFRFTSELNGLNNGNIHTRASIKHEFFKEKFFRVIPALEIGYQAANNNIDRRNGISDITSRLQFYFGNFLVGLNAIHRPNVYMFDNDRNFTRLGQYANTNSDDGKIVDPSKSAGLINQSVIDSVLNSDIHSAAKQFIIQDYQEQKIVRNIFIVNIGYTLKF